jgi:hypothetical protein
MTELLCKNCGARIELFADATIPTYRHANHAIHCDLDDDTSLTAEPK